MNLMDTMGLLALALLAAKLLGGLGERLRIPPVLMEVGVGVLLGNLGSHLGLEFQGEGTGPEVLRGLSELGVLFLLFVVGLETDLAEVRKVGVDAAVAALAGVVVPFALAFAVMPLFFPGFGLERTLFVAAALTATSVGITARVLQDLGKLGSVSGRIIIGAAVIDDILGIIVLAVVTALATQGSVSAGEMSLLLAKIAAFFGLFFLMRKFLLPSVIGRMRPLEISGTVTILLVSLCLLAAWAAERLGLAGIVGAFALGLVLDDVQFRGWEGTRNWRLAEVIRPVTDFLAPIFFIVMGMGVKLSALFRTDALILGGVLVACGVLGKLVCGIFIRKSSVQAGGDRLLVGVGMIPRGEVGLIFAAMGARLGLLDEGHYSAVVFMVVATTLLAPMLISLRVKALSPGPRQAGS